jgi:DNA-binding transcriptional regulator YiaG
MNTTKKLEPRGDEATKKAPRRQGVPTRSIGIGALRRADGVTQEVIAERMGVTQAQVSRIEQSDDSIEVRTLRAYAESLGAVLEVCFTVDGRRLRVM